MTSGGPTRVVSNGPSRAAGRSAAMATGARIAPTGPEDEAHAAPASRLQHIAAFSTLPAHVSKADLARNVLFATPFLTAGFFAFGILQLALTWIGLALIFGPLCPPQYTGGDISVGKGPELAVLAQPQSTDDAEKRPSKSGNLRRRLVSSEPEVAVVAAESTLAKAVSAEAGSEWSRAEVEALRRAMQKHPKGVPSRWEVIASSLGGVRSVSEVSAMAAKIGEKKPVEGDAYAAFLAQRKPVDVASPLSERESEGNPEWSEGQDTALLKALKEFPKDTALRWEKVAAAVPGRTKGQCFKRFNELKEDFRSSKATGTGGEFD